MYLVLVFALAVAGTAWKVDPSLRPGIDAGMAALVCLLSFRVGVAVDGWLDRWENRPPRRIRRRLAVRPGPG
jgi:hypothetical protein